MAQLVKRKIVRCIELRLNGKLVPLYIDHAGFVANQERITNLESECGESLPQDYKEFLMAYNGVRLLTLDADSPKPVLSYLSNIKEVSDFALAGAILEGITFDKNSIALIGSNHDGSVYTFMNLQGKKKGEIYHYHTNAPSDPFKQPAYKSFTDMLQSLTKTDYAKQVAKSSLVKLATSKANSPPRDDEESKVQTMPINSKKFPHLSDVVNTLFDKVETEENEHGRIVVKNKLDKRKIVLIMTYVRDTLHEQIDNDIQSYFDFFSPFRMYLITENELEELMKEGLIDENDELTKKGTAEAEKIIVEESEKAFPKKEFNSFFRPAVKNCVDVVLNGKTTPLQLSHIGTIINETRIKKFEKDLGHTLPKEYREFLLAYNGGAARQSNLIIDGNIETVGIRTYRDLQTLEDRLYLGGSQNIEWIAIGTDKNEHLVYINLKGDKRGYIYRYQYGEGADETTVFTDAPKQLLAKSFFEFVLNVQDGSEGEDGKEDEEYLDTIVPYDTKAKYPQLLDVMWTLYEATEKQEGKYGRITIPNRQDIQNVILMVKYLTATNSEAFVTVMNHTPFKFFTILDTHVDDLKKAKLLDKNGKITKRGKEEVEKLLVETKVPETKKGKDKKKEKQPKTPPKATEKTLKRKLEKVEKEEDSGRHVTRSSVKEGSASKKR